MMPKLDRDEYMAHGGIFCPYCQGSDLTKEFWQECLGKVTLDVFCHDCKRTWMDVFVLVAVKEMKQK